jgi:hypothetical protein
MGQTTAVKQTVAAATAATAVREPRALGSNMNLENVNGGRDTAPIVEVERVEAGRAIEKMEEVKEVRVLVSPWCSCCHASHLLNCVCPCSVS